MNTKRFNITLPLDVANDIKDIKNKSAFISNAIKEYSENKIIGI